LFVRIKQCPYFVSIGINLNYPALKCMLIRIFHRRSFAGLFPGGYSYRPVNIPDDRYLSIPRSKPTFLCGLKLAGLSFHFKNPILLTIPYEQIWTSTA